MKQFYYWLDPIRAIAALLVLLVHARSVMFVTYDNLIPESQTLFTQIFYFICSLGGFAVCLFYILSGFLVGGSTIHKIRENNVDPRRFFLNRLFRIGVPLTGALCLIAVTNGLIGQNTSIVQLLGQYTGLQGLVFRDYGGVFWTLPYEIWFYALLFSLLIFIGRTKHIMLGVIVFVCCLVVFANLLPQFLYVLACGILCYICKDIELNRKILGPLWCMLMVLFGLYFVSQNFYILHKLNLVDIQGPFQTFSQLALFSVIAVVLSQYVCKQPSSRIGIAVNKYGKNLATFSYSLFLTHYQVLKFWIASGLKFDCINVYTSGVFLGVLLSCIAVAYIFYLLFEKQTTRVQMWVESRFKISV